MAYDEDLANRVRERLGREPGITERRMFGGLAMMLRGNTAVAVRDPDLARWVDRGVRFARTLPAK
ncbi:hypothetical protein [Micromonospora tulbaghiae]|uniref:hypothetical protein n=1 Tax=Micromonospora tulbaghiae TaxID=479978 RepID=UPI000E0537C3|nr:hypothetical protein [Micromonospora provocatoris]RBJ00044.1 hypothetical protein DRA43_22035 [Micromonospora provocatoris]